MKIEDWIKTEELFTEKFGWKKGINMITAAHREILRQRRLPGNTGVEMLDPIEDKLLKNKLRRMYGSRKEN